MPQTDKIDRETPLQECFQSRCTVLRLKPGYSRKVSQYTMAMKKGTDGWDENTTQYAKKRRRLREHRDEMRIMFDLIEEQGWEDELEERLIVETGNNGFWLGRDDSVHGVDLHSDEDEDPEEKLREEVRELKSQLADRRTLIQALTEHRQLVKIALDMERARMKSEDRDAK